MQESTTEVTHLRGGPENSLPDLGTSAKKKGCFFSMCSRRCLECRNHAKNLINGKISFFYIELILQKISQLRKKHFQKEFSSAQKKIREFFTPKKSHFLSPKIRQFWVSDFVIFDFGRTFFQKYVFQKWFLWSTFFSEFFSELRKKCWYSFDVENSDLSIYRVFSAFWARQIEFIECQRQRYF